MTDETKRELLRIALSTSVPLMIREIKEGQRRRWEDADFHRASGLLGSQGDAILYREPRREKRVVAEEDEERVEEARQGTARMFNLLAEAIANMAFCPGRIKVFGMELSNGWLNSTSRDESPNRGGLFAAQPSFLILHYTASQNAQSAIDTLCNPESKVSAHFVVDHDGMVVQLVPVTRIAWHAGRSKWGEIEGLNSVSLGIEMVNAGELVRAEGDAELYKAWWGGIYKPSAVVAFPLRGNSPMPRYWHAYTREQLQTVFNLCLFLCDEFSIPTSQVLGHEDVAPRRKVDPGPAFPMGHLREHVGLFRR